MINEEKIMSLCVSDKQSLAVYHIRIVAKNCRIIFGPRSIQMWTRKRNLSITYISYFNLQGEFNPPFFLIMGNLIVLFVIAMDF